MLLVDKFQKIDYFHNPFDLNSILVVVWGRIYARIKPENLDFDLS